MKKQITAAVLAMTMAVSLTACGGGGKGSEEKKVSATTGKEAVSTDKELSGTITIWSWDVALAHLQEEAEKFSEIYPNVEFNFEEMGVSQVYSKITTCLQSGIGLPDIVQLEGEQVAKFGEKFPDKFVDFTGEVKAEEFLPIKIAECTVNGKMVAFPWDAGPCGMFYRTDIFEQAGVKAEDIVTWDDFIEAGKTIKEKTGIDMMTLATARKDTTYRMLMMELGGFYFDEAGNTAVNSPESVRAMEMIQKIYAAGITVNDGSWDDFIAALSGSKIACVSEAVWLAGSIKDAAADQAGKWRVMDLPKFDADKDAGGASNGGSVLTVPAASESKEAAMEFVKFAMTDVEGNVAGFVNYGLYPSYIPALDSDVFKEGDEFFGGQKIYDIFTEVGKKIPKCNYTSNFAEAIDLSKNAVSKVTLDNQDVQTVMDGLQEEMKAKFGK
ncbi:MAG: sugar ABC transporter substrate-binding protein [Hungatella sp.]